MTSTTATKQLSANALAYLEKEGFPQGLIHAMLTLKKDCHKQIWIIDNSEPMNQKDGHVLSQLEGGDKIGFQPGTRWEELQKCTKAHIQMAGAFQIPASFRLLNPPTNGVNVDAQEFTIGYGSGGEYDIETEVKRGLEIMDTTKPHSHSPLTTSILKVATEIEAMKEELAKSGKHVAVVLCTDGVPSDSTREFLVEQLKKLEALPVQMVVRLCTDEPSVVEYYNEIDKLLDIRLDVLDDFQGEALETCKANPWLTYSLPLHRCREMGFFSPVLDNLDEAALSTTEQMELCELLFGKGKMTMCPTPEVDEEGFVAHIKMLQQDEAKQWDPIMEETKPWIDTELMKNPKDKLAKMRHIQQKKKGKWLVGVFKRMSLVKK